MGLALLTQRPNKSDGAAFGASESTSMPTATVASSSVFFFVAAPVAGAAAAIRAAAARSKSSSVGGSASHAASAASEERLGELQLMPRAGPQSRIYLLQVHTICAAGRVQDPSHLALPVRVAVGAVALSTRLIHSALCKIRLHSRAISQQHNSRPRPRATTDCLCTATYRHRHVADTARAVCNHSNLSCQNGSINHKATADCVCGLTRAEPARDVDEVRLGTEGLHVGDHPELWTTE